MTFLATRTRFGRYVFATGGNPEAAELAGINTKRLTVMVFTLMGALVAISAVISSARLDSATNASASSTNSMSSPQRSSAARRWPAASARFMAPCSARC